MPGGMSARKLPQEVSILLVLLGMALIFEVLGWLHVNQSFLGNSTRLMVRYTKDSWVASNLAGGTDGVWGDSQTSIVGSDWDQPGKSLVGQLNNNIGSKMTNTLTFSYSANVINVSRSGDSALVDELNTLIPTLYPSSIKQRGGVAQREQHVKLLLADAAAQHRELDRGLGAGQVPFGLAAAEQGPAHRAVQLPPVLGRLVRRGAAARGVAGHQVGARAEPADRAGRAEPPRLGAQPAQVLPRVAAVGELPVEYAG